MADYSSPKPVDPIWYQPYAYLHIGCGCGRSLVEPLAQFARRNRLSDGLLLHKLIARLRCRHCRQRPAWAEVTRSRHRIR